MRFVFLALAVMSVSAVPVLFRYVIAEPHTSVAQRCGGGPCANELDVSSVIGSSAVSASRVAASASGRRLAHNVPGLVGRAAMPGVDGRWPRPLAKLLGIPAPSPLISDSDGSSGGVEPVNGVDIESLLAADLLSSEGGGAPGDSSAGGSASAAGGSPSVAGFGSAPFFGGGGSGRGGSASGLGSALGTTSGNEPATPTRVAMSEHSSPLALLGIGLSAVLAAAAMRARSARHGLLPLR
jgi:hypothetical protein